MSILPEASWSGAELARYAAATVVLTLVVALRYGNLGLTMRAGVDACGLSSLTTCGSGGQGPHWFLPTARFLLPSFGNDLRVAGGAEAGDHEARYDRE